MFCHDKRCLNILTNLTGIRNEWQRFDREETAVYITSITNRTYLFRFPVKNYTMRSAVLIGSYSH